MLNRANRKARCFESAADYAAFERILEAAVERSAMRLLTYVVMPNHWHLVVHPRRDGDISRFMQWLQQVHAQRWNVVRGAVGSGHLYQGRYKSFLIQDEAYLRNVLRYVEANPVRWGLTSDGREWRWGAMHRRRHGDAAARRLLHRWPTRVPRNWAELVNAYEDGPEAERIRHSMSKGTPYGEDRWVQRTCRRYGLESLTRRPGRPMHS